MASEVTNNNRLASQQQGAEIPRLPRNQMLYGTPDYLDDPDGLARWREIAKQSGGHNMAPVNINSLRRLLDTIERLRVALSTPTPPTEFSPIAASGEWVEPGEAFQLLADLHGALSLTAEYKGETWVGYFVDHRDEFQRAAKFLAANQDGPPAHPAEQPTDADVEKVFSAFCTAIWGDANASCCPTWVREGLIAALQPADDAQSKGEGL